MLIPDFEGAGFYVSLKLSFFTRGEKKTPAWTLNSLHEMLLCLSQGIEHAIMSTYNQQKSIIMERFSLNMGYLVPPTFYLFTQLQS